MKDWCAVATVYLLLLTHIFAAPTAKEEARLQWNRQTLTGDYLRAGKRNPKWDLHVTNAFEAFARMRSAPDKADTNQWNQFSQSIRAAMKAECDDPLVRYLNARVGVNDGQQDPVTLANEQRFAANAILKSDYSHVRRYYTCSRAASALKATVPSGKPYPVDVSRFRHAAATNLNNMLRDKATPVEEAFEAFWDLMDLVDANPRQFADYCLSAEKIMSEHWPNEALAWYARGEMYVRYAWDGRGAQYADKVTGDQWKLFEERLPMGGKALLKSWQLDPSDGRVPARMITVMMGVNSPRREMEKWFERAMTADTNNFTACDRKRYYLEPKWHGSAEEMLAFGRECVKSEKWGGRVPLVLVDTHDALARYLPKEKRSEYWTSTPEIWQDVKASFEKFFKLNPEAIGWRHNYARYAYWCEQWGDLKKQISLLGPLNYDYFGGKAEYEKMVRLANERAKRE